MHDTHKPPRWDEIAYLKEGTPRQQQAFETLTALGIFDFLRLYSPILIGTIPLDVDVETSDLDIACYSPDLALFARDVTVLYGSQPHFRLRHKQVRGTPSVVTSFEYNGFEIQFFVQPQPVEHQYGYRHMLVEARLLALGGEAARHAIRELKRSGIKTEPAFATYFGLNGDPYELLWELSWLPDGALRERLRRS
jgi:hypothetical protein